MSFSFLGGSSPGFFSPPFFFLIQNKKSLLGFLAPKGKGGWGGLLIAMRVGGGNTKGRMRIN